MMTCQISDGSGILNYALFSTSMRHEKAATGRRVLAYGEAKRGKYGAEMIHPEYRVRAISARQSYRKRSRRFTQLRKA